MLDAVLLEELASLRVVRALFEGHLAEAGAGILSLPDQLARAGAVLVELCENSQRSVVLGANRRGRKPEAATVTSSDSDSVPVLKFFNPDPEIIKIRESDSCSDSDYHHRSNRNLSMSLLKKWPHKLLLLPECKSDSRFGF